MSTTTMETEAVLVVRARAGNRTAFDRLMERERRNAIRYAASRLNGRLDLAEDAVQAAFVEAWRDLPALRSPQAFPAWLRRLVFKQCDRRYRTRSHTLPLEAASDTADSAPFPDVFLIEAQENTRRRTAVRLMVSSLPLGERDAVLLFYMGGCSYREVSEYLGISLTAVKSRLHSARTRIRERMGHMSDATMELAGPETANLDLTEVERETLLSEIEDFYRQYTEAFDVMDVEKSMALLTDDYELIFPADSGLEPWDKARCEKDCRAAGPKPPGTLLMRTIIEDLLSAGRDPATGIVDRCVVCCTFIKEGPGFKRREPTHRIDTFVREGGKWKTSRTISLFRDDNRPEWIKKRPEALS